MNNGRVIDPESGLDELTDLAVVAGQIAKMGPAGTISAGRSIDATGLVVAPGFIDLHSHALDTPGMRLQAFDGVTTALELECGALPIGSALRWIEDHRPLLNYGVSASWALARQLALSGDRAARLVDYRAPIDYLPALREPATGRRTANRRERRKVRDLLQRELEAGALGIGVVLGYVPWAGDEEVADLFALAVEFRAPLFVHSRSMAQGAKRGAVRAVLELVEAAEQSGAHVHLCHLNSTSGHAIREISAIVTAATRRGVAITTEAYPYGSGFTKIGAAFLSPESLEEIGLPTDAIVYLATGERVTNAERLTELRATDPDGYCVVRILDETKPEERDLLIKSLSFPGAAVASDAVLAQRGGDSLRTTSWRTKWPLPADARAHPRSAGTFARALSWLQNSTQPLTLAEALRKCTLIPADILSSVAPSMRAKGRLQVGADADITVFDPDGFQDRATYAELLPSVGVKHVIVSGVEVIRSGILQAGAHPGRAIAGRPAQD